MASIREYIDIAVSPGSVWSVVGAPGAICEWHPGIVSSPLVDGVRTCTLREGGEVAEAILEHSDEQRYYVYTTVGDSFGMLDYRSRIQVYSHDDGTRVVWTGEFDVDEPSAAEPIVQAVAATYREGLTALHDVVTTAG